MPTVDSTALCCSGYLEFGELAAMMADPEAEHFKLHFDPNTRHHLRALVQSPLDWLLKIDKELESSRAKVCHTQTQPFLLLSWPAV